MDSLGCAFLPASCALCGSPLPHLSYAPICAACWSEISAESGAVCDRCGDALHTPPPQPNAEALCRTCRLAPPPFVRAVSFGPYSGRMRDAIHALKYDRLSPAARNLGQILALAIARLAPDAPGEMLVIPVPLHKSKHFDRGFNQARLLATEALACLRATHPQWNLELAPSTLMRLRATNSQAGLTPRQRRLNVRGAFKVADPAAVAAKHILVVDDILTTGATARAVARALLQAGAESVCIATLARARLFMASRPPAFTRNSDEALLRSMPGTLNSSNFVEESMHASQNHPSF